MKMTSISKTYSIRLNLQENRTHRELTIDTIISFMNIIWCHLYSWIWRVKIFLVIFILFRYDNLISFVARNVNLKDIDISH